MIKITNDKGETVTAVGAEGSDERIKCEYPAMMERAKGFLFWYGTKPYDEQIALKLVRFALKEKERNI